MLGDEVASWFNSGGIRMDPERRQTAGVDIGFVSGYDSGGISSYWVCDFRL